MRYFASRTEGWNDLVIVVAKNGRVMRTYWKPNSPYPEWDGKKATDTQVFAVDRMTDFYSEEA